MATNEILRFAETDTGTNLLTQAEYAADSQRPIGNQPGVARSKLVNKALRQSSLLAAGLAEFLADNQSNDITDGLTPQNIADYLLAAMQGGLGVTAPQFDNDTSLATTAFVQRALGNYAGWKQISSSQTLNASDAGLACYVSGESAITVTLPALAGVPIGATFTFLSNSANAVTVAGQSGELIALKNPTSLASIAIANGETLQVTKITSTLWMAINGTSTLKENASFAASLSTNGYQKLPSGLIIQWGIFAHPGSGSGGLLLNYPISFPNGLFAGTAIENGGTPAIGYSMQPVNQTQFRLFTTNPTTNYAQMIFIGF